MQNVEGHTIGIRPHFYFSTNPDTLGVAIRRRGVITRSNNSNGSTSKVNNSKDDNSKGNIESCKKLKASPGDEVRPWTELPPDILYVISKRISMQDYLSFGRVCTKWRSNFRLLKKDVLTSIPPLVLLLSPRRPESCFFYNISDSSICEIKIPCFSRKLFHGVSSGYLVMEGSENDIWLTNPITGHHLITTKPPEYAESGQIFDLLIIALIIPQKDILMVGLTKKHPRLCFRRSSDPKWTSYQYSKGNMRFMDMVVFNFKVYVLGSDCHIAVLNLKATPCLTILPLKGRPKVSRCRRFVTSDDRLLVVDFVVESWLHIYEIDLVKMEWVKITNLGDMSLFFSNSKGSRLLNPKKWGGRSNCLYQLWFMFDRCRVHSLNRDVLEEHPIGVGGTQNFPRSPIGWYFPESAYDMDVVEDDVDVAEDDMDVAVVENNKDVVQDGE